MPKVVKSVEEIRERDRVYHRRKYDEKLDENRAKARERYYAKKEANPEFCSKPRGRPRKVANVADNTNASANDRANEHIINADEQIRTLCCEF